jgi:hypothetical protein
MYWVPEVTVVPGRLRMEMVIERSLGSRTWEA